MTTLDTTHDPNLRSWVASANDPRCDFPIQNLPFGRFRKAGSTDPFRIGIAIGDQVLDLRAAGVIDTADMNELMAAAPAKRRALRATISAGLREGSADQAAWAMALLPQAQCARCGHGDCASRNEAQPPRRDAYAASTPTAVSGAENRPESTPSTAESSPTQV